MPSHFLQEWARRLRHWSAMFAGTSYYHLPQGIGRVFVPGELKGYFNDLTGKTNWKGKVDHDGLPINTLTNGEGVHFPILLCQKALGHWDRWLIANAPEDQQQFLKIAAWAASSQDGLGGWDTWGPLGQSAKYRYSAMTQGQAISVMVRAFCLTKDPALEAACDKAIVMMRRPVKDGGVCWYEADEVFLEEFPGPSRDTVLNGWIFALFGIHDFLLLFPDQDVKVFYERSCASLVRALPEFDTGFWSYYSSRTKRMTSPFYHDLHISQLRALSKIISEPALRSTLDAWTRYANRRVNRLRALAIKGIQKIREPVEVTIVD